MFDKFKMGFARFLTVYTGTDELYEGQVVNPLISGNASNSFTPATDAEKLLAISTSVKVIADAMSRLPLNVYQIVDKGNLIDRTDRLNPIR